MDKHSPIERIKQAGLVAGGAVIGAVATRFVRRGESPVADSPDIAQGVDNTSSFDINVVHQTPDTHLPPTDGITAIPDDTDTVDETVKSKGWRKPLALLAVGATLGASPFVYRSLDSNESEEAPNESAMSTATATTEVPASTILNTAPSSTIVKVTAPQTTPTAPEAAQSTAPTTTAATETPPSTTDLQATTTTEAEPADPYLELLQSPERNDQVKDNMTEGVVALLNSLEDNNVLNKRVRATKISDSTSTNLYDVSTNGNYKLSDKKVSINLTADAQSSIDTDAYALKIGDILSAGLTVQSLEATFEDPEREGDYYSRANPYIVSVIVEETINGYSVQIDTMDDLGSSHRTVVSSAGVSEQTIDSSGQITNNEQLKDADAIAQADSRIQETLALIASSISA